MIDPIIQKDVDNLADEFSPQFSQKNILVTGGAGFLGSWICDVLVGSGAHVDCLDNLSTGLKENIDHLKAEMNVIIADVEEAELKGDYDYIFHFSSRASPEEYMRHQIETLRSNSLGIMRMLELANKKHDCIFVQASTSEIYGDAQVIPTPETYWGYVNSIGMRSCYDEGKRFAEALCMAYLRQKKVDVRIVRIFNTYGPRIRSDGLYGRALPRFVSQALRGQPLTIFGNGKQTRSFCYVSDTIRGILRLSSIQKRDDLVVNIGNPNEITILDLAMKIISITKSSSRWNFLPALPDDPNRRCPDISKAEKILNWQPKVHLEEGLSHTMATLSGKNQIKRFETSAV